MVRQSRRAGKFAAAVGGVLAAMCVWAQPVAPEAAPITLENAHVRIVVVPAVGGRVESFVHKQTGRDLVLKPAAGPYWGLLGDGLWQQNFEHGDWNRSPYAVISSEPGKLALEGRGRQWAGVKIRKTLTLGAERAALDVEYEVTAAPPSPARAMGDLWITSALQPGATVFMPLASGVVERPLPAQTESWGFEPSRGWMAALSGDTGLALAVDFSRLRAFRSVHEERTTVEWVLRKAALKPGAKLNTWATLAPVTGLKRVDGVCRQLAVSMDCAAPAGGKSVVTIGLAAFEKLSPTFLLSVRRLPDGPAQKAAELTPTLTPAAATTVAADVPVAGDGTYVVECDVRVEAKSVLRFEKPLFAGKPSGNYALAPESARAGEAPDYPTKGRFHPIDMNFNCPDVMPPERVWAKPYVGGRPKVLALLPHHSSRQAVELAQRFDMELTAPFVAPSGFYALGDRYLSLNIKDIHEGQEKAILGKKFDVIVLDNGMFRGKDANHPDPLLTDKVRQYVLKLVQEGAGLVYIARGAEPKELESAVPLKHQGYDWAHGPYLLQKTSNPVLNALPWDALPNGHDQCGYKLRAEKPKDDLLPEAGERDAALVSCVMPHATMPIIATAQWGKGRLAQLGWNAPFLPNSPTVRGRDMKDPPPFDYWEYHHMVLARLIYWAARMESPLTLREIECSPKQVKIVATSKIVGAVELHWRLRDEFGATLAEGRKPVEFQAGPATVLLDVPAEVGPSYFLADVVFKGEPETLAFGAGALKRQGAQIKSVKFDKALYEPGAPAQVEVLFSAVPPAGAQARVELLDGFGRKVAEATAPVAAEKATLTVAPARGIGYVVEARAALLQADGLLLDQGFGATRLRPDREASRAKFQTFFWGGAASDGMPPYLINKTFRLYQYIGMSADLESEAPLVHGRRELEYLNMPLSSGSVGMACNNGVRKADMAAKGDAETFTSPKVAQGLREATARVVKEKEAWNVLMFTMGDECRAPLPDTDFTKTGLAEFRKWLQAGQYNSLDALNAEWRTAFKTWDEVLPMSEAEIKAHGPQTKSYAAWADQQQFNKWVWANRAREAMAGFFSVDPKTRAGESGTQEPDTYSGRDYWLIMQNYTALASYGGEQDNQQMSYRPDMLRYPWAGYGKPSPILRTSTWPLLGTINRGIAFFHDKSHYDPDFSLPECGRDLRATLQEMIYGVGQLMVEAKPHQQPVYLLQSSASLHGAYALGNQALGAGERDGAAAVFMDLVAGYRHISYEQVARGDLEKFGAKALVLPYSVALSEAECQGIRRWVQAGGLLIADLDSGIMTAHCRLLDRGQLDDVFGIDRSGAQLRTGKDNENWTAGDGARALKVGAVQTGLKGAAKPAWTARQGQETAPALFVNPFGKGKALYFACDFFRAYNEAVDKSGGAEGYAQMVFAQETFEKALREIGWRPPVTTLTPGADGKAARAPFFRTWHKVLGDQRYFLSCRLQKAFFEAPAADLPATALFDQPGYVYDVLNGKELGWGDRVDLTLTDYTIRLFAVLPYRVTGVTADAPATAQPGKDVVARLTVQAQGKPGLHVLRVDVLDPAGRPSRCYSDNVVAPEGVADFKLPFALNDLPGAWTLHVRDVTSGHSATRKVDLAKTP
jgi:hypothetical protein